MHTECYALYRLPYADSYTHIRSSRPPAIVAGYDDIGRMSGFVIAPFACSDTDKIIIIHADEILSATVPADTSRDMQGMTPAGSQPATQPTEQYCEAFSRYHNAIAEGKFSKLVLARKRMQARINGDSREEAAEIFFRACRTFPRLMIMLFSTPESGTWIIASPEILVEGTGSHYHTVALAGTMPYSEGYAEWSEKNKREQKVVESYIESILSDVAEDIIKDGPTTMRAGSLAHLRTDFRFSLHGKEDGISGNALGMLLSRLHPTPAVCGMPKEEAKNFILRNEGMERRYYSGFAGPVDISGETHLYVSLRCAEITEEAFWLYAGGGIMPDSLCLNEWKETEEKMKTISHVLR